MKHFAVITLLGIILTAWMADAQRFRQNGPPPGVIYRNTWGARSPKYSPEDLEVKPALYVIIHHSTTDLCTTQAECEARVRSMQNYDMDHNNKHDIAFNFLIGEDGHIYEGRGWGVKGSHSATFNNNSIGIGFIGDFDARKPNQTAIIAARNLLKWGVRNGGLMSNYKLMGHRQNKNTECPGDKLYELIQTWPHWHDPTARSSSD